jgi:hypothetical protein
LMLIILVFECCMARYDARCASEGIEEENKRVMGCTGLF